MKQTAEEIYEELFQRYPQLKVCREDIKDAYNLLKDCYTNGGKVLVCGNGGSAADSEHIVGELMKGFILKRKINQDDVKKLKAAFIEDWQYLSENLQGALPAISLVSQSAISTAFINDVEPDMVYAQQVYGYVKPGDILIGLSTSGNAKNVADAIKVAKAFGAHTIGLTGENGGAMKALCDITIQAPSSVTFIVQEYHLPIYHALCAMVESEFFDI
jgi:D-sedoheptulose 7-phosphate isomerase